MMLTISGTALPVQELSMCVCARDIKRYKRELQKQAARHHLCRLHPYPCRPLRRYGSLFVCTCWWKPGSPPSREQRGSQTRPTQRFPAGTEETRRLRGHAGAGRGGTHRPHLEAREVHARIRELDEPVLPPRGCPRCMFGQLDLGIVACPEDEVSICRSLPILKTLDIGLLGRNIVAELPHVIGKR
jgi:hypothetical protein